MENNLDNNLNNNLDNNLNNNLDNNLSNLNKLKIDNKIIINFHITFISYFNDTYKIYIYFF